MHTDRGVTIVDFHFRSHLHFWVQYSSTTAYISSAKVETRVAFSFSSTLFSNSYGFWCNTKDRAHRRAQHGLQNLTVITALLSFYQVDEPPSS